MATFSREAIGLTADPPGYVISTVVGEVYVHHFNSNIVPPATVEDAFIRIRNADHYHAVTQLWGGLGYSWCVDDAGNIYEGRGWWRTGAHTFGYNSKGYGICWLGDSFRTTPSVKALAAIAQCIHDGIRAGAIVPRPTIVAHRDRNPDTSCCGDGLYAQLDVIRAAVLDNFTPVTTNPPEEDDMTEDQDRRLKFIENVAAQIAEGHIQGAVIKELQAQVGILASSVNMLTDSMTVMSDMMAQMSRQVALVAAPTNPGVLATEIRRSFGQALAA